MEKVLQGHLLNIGNSLEIFFFKFKITTTITTFNFFFNICITL